MEAVFIQFSQEQALDFLFFFKKTSQKQLNNLPDIITISLTLTYC